MREKIVQLERQVDDLLKWQDKREQQIMGESSQKLIDRVVEGITGEKNHPIIRDMDTALNLVSNFTARVTENAERRIKGAHVVMRETLEQELQSMKVNTLSKLYLFFLSKRGRFYLG